MGSLSLDTPDPYESLDDKQIYDSLPDKEQWRKQLEVLENSATAEFSTFPQGNQNQLSFVFGSCRYPGILWAKKRADMIFRAILERFENPNDGTTPRLFLMVGDQIYADTLPKAGGLVVANTEEEFRERYMSAFGSPYTRSVLRSVSTYMILDDHEIEDNWVQGRLKLAEKRNLFNLALRAYMSYQWVHCPRNYGDDGDQNRGNRLYYSFEACGFPFFVVDGRTQRIRDDPDEDVDLTDNHMLGRPSKGKDYKGQIDELCAWLDAQQKAKGDRPKFVVTASVFVPNEVSTTKSDEAKARDDSWAAFPNTRRQLLQTILDKKVQNVVFISGDIHCSNVAKMEFVREGNVSPLKAYSVTSSAFYWPYPFADGDPLNYVHDSHAEKDDFDVENGYVMRYQAWNFQQNDNFSQVDLDWTVRTLRVRTFGKDGKELNKETIPLA
jgi:alkaline phosphatase D